MFISTFPPFLPSSHFLYCSLFKKENNKRDLLSFSPLVTTCSVCQLLLQLLQGGRGNNQSAIQIFPLCSRFFLIFAFIQEQQFLYFMTLHYPPYIMLSLFVVVLGYFWLLLLFCKLPLSILLCFREREFCDAVSINLFPTEEQFL